MTPKNPEQGPELTIIGHLNELRKRVIQSLYGVLLGFIVAYSFSEALFNILLQPLCETFQQGACPIVYTSVIEPFMLYLRVGILGGLFLAVPWLFYQVWLFVSPGLRSQEKRYVVPFVTVASVMFLCGALLGYFFIFPFAFEFFTKVAPVSIQPMLSMSDYFSFASSLLVAFGILFEIPVFVVLLNIIGVVSAKTLWKTWRISVAGIYILAAILTPADPYTLLLLGTPLAVLYLAALTVCSLVESARSKSDVTGLSQVD